MRIHGMYSFLYYFILFRWSREKKTGQRPNFFSIDIKYITQIRLDRSLTQKKKFFISPRQKKWIEKAEKGEENKLRRVQKCGTSYLLSFIESTSLYGESIYDNNNKNHNRIIVLEMKRRP